ncbi:HD domain-containing protein [Cyanobacterium aponinum]|uniref:HD domain-containing protein n=1 Tax=Cyanobacterium aponinum TaxID=379064 RepID=UPI000C12DEAE|nr:HD domain-containing protein [Cyanobacterium aponinum]PHV62379.1 phosphohydrolase [Cyanobacterium aponinum IPPAS B-1201]
MKYWNPEIYLKAWNFASVAHQTQLMSSSNVPYLNHIGSVAMEAMTAITYSDNIQYPDLLIQCALLHDVIEDTDISYEEIKREFSLDVADGVLALTKNKKLPSKQEQMEDSLNRITQQPPEIWMVKMCDRITNLQPPPRHWSQNKIIKYRQEAILIWEKLGTANQYLAQRLDYKITQYHQYQTLTL